MVFGRQVIMIKFYKTQSDRLLDKFSKLYEMSKVYGKHSIDDGVDVAPSVYEKTLMGKNVTQ